MRVVRPRRSFLLDTAPLLELTIADYSGAGAIALNERKRLPLGTQYEVLRATVRSPSVQLFTTGGVVSELDHHAELLRQPALGQFHAFVREWLIERDVHVTGASPNSWDEECVTRFGLTDADVLATSRLQDVPVLLHDARLESWALANGFYVLSVWDLSAPEP